jgi:hypothetical protein
MLLFLLGTWSGLLVSVPLMGALATSKRADQSVCPVCSLRTSSARSFEDRSHRSAS